MIWPMKVASGGKSTKTGLTCRCWPTKGDRNSETQPTWDEVLSAW